MQASNHSRLRRGPLDTPTDLGSQASKDISAGLNVLLADMFALYLKTKNFHWHVSGPHFRSHHLLFREQATQIIATADAIAERVRKIGGRTLRSIGDVARLQRLTDNDTECMPAFDMLVELCDDNLQVASHLREAHDICEEHGDVASATLIGSWIDEAERRVWFLFEASRRDDDTDAPDPA
jgi:starvation-inducible DNA-binding protein